MKSPLAADNMRAGIDGLIGGMTFNKPARRNAVLLNTWGAIPVILDHFEQDPAVQVIVPLLPNHRTARSSAAEARERAWLIVWCR